MAVDLLSQDPNWSDLNPIPQIEPEGSLVPIMYSLEYEDAMGYFRALAAKEEFSDRALEVTLRVIRMNPAHYTVWQYRFKTLMELGCSLEDELQLMTELAEDNMKSYQVWHHRLLLLTHLPAPISPSTIHRELAFISTSLLPDAKNYHTWAYRQYVLTHFGPLMTPEDWAAELKWCEGLLASSNEKERAVEQVNESDGREEEEEEWVEEEEERERGDVRNNSAWTHRWFLAFGREGARGKEGIEDEVRYTTDQIRLVPNNTSSWAYLRGVHTRFSIPFSNQADLALSVQQACEGKGYGCPLAVEWMVDVHEEQGSMDEARGCLGRLIELDPIRKSYWEYRQADLSVSNGGGSETLPPTLTASA